MEFRRVLFRSYRLSALGPVSFPGRLERAIRLSADAGLPHDPFRAPAGGRRLVDAAAIGEGATRRLARERATALYAARLLMSPSSAGPLRVPVRSEEHTSELQSLMRISYAVFCLKKKNNE